MCLQVEAVGFQGLTHLPLAQKKTNIVSLSYLCGPGREDGFTKPINNQILKMESVSLLKLIPDICVD